ncbi:MAG: hypothetical protein A6F71_00515 [Cycloclasticus sp. symbiont of Poecilosclerida sp. M]|nr:MAG: hypothetical protein A6F71_00515 [Cycloclasticus sp. symbiont of Poecilosclerida sp. M]
MNIIKTVLSATLLTLLVGCSEVNDDNNIDLNQKFAINGIFDIYLGKIDNEIPEGYLIENKNITFTPNNADERFVKYEYSTTPKSHIIYGIRAKSLRELPKESCLERRKYLIEQTLNELGDTSKFRISEEENKWKVREANQRQITVDCETSITPNELQLVMIYQDTALSLLAFKEWKKRQKEITLIRF